MRTAFAMPMCAGIRAARSMKRYLDRIHELMRQKRGLKPVLITLTVKNGESLEERYNHLTRSFRTLLSRYRDYKKKVGGLINFAKLMVRLHHGIHLQRNYQTMASAYSYFCFTQ